jgi:hypothetical protein
VGKNIGEKASYMNGNDNVQIKVRIWLIISKTKFDLALFFCVGAYMLSFIHIIALVKQLYESINHYNVSSKL